MFSDCDSALQMQGEQDFAFSLKRPDKDMMKKPMDTLSSHLPITYSHASHKHALLIVLVIFRLHFIGGICGWKNQKHIQSNASGWGNGIQ